MFTGLVEEMGRIKSIQNKGDGSLLNLNAHHILSDLHIGDSVSIDGICLTVIFVTDDGFSVEAVSETLSRTNLGNKKVGDWVNLERALPANGRLGGHIVQGHIDGRAVIHDIEKRQSGYWLTITVDESLAIYIVEKGSIALNGISLTIAAVDKNRLSLAVIPYTWEHTTLGENKVGDVMNVEIDILAKYVSKMLHYTSNDSKITWDKLENYGYRK